MAGGAVAAGDDRRHAPGEGEWWAEAFGLDAWLADGSLGVTSWHVLLPNQGRAWYWAALVRRDRPLLSVVDLDQRLPVGTLRLRGGSLWAELTCEEPLRQWTVANETYAVALDDPEEALRRGLGDPAPVAFDLEWYATGEPARGAPEGCEGFTVTGEVHGEVELREGRVPVVGPATWTRWWGVRDWFGGSVGEPAPAEALRAPVLLTDGVRHAALDRWLTPDGWSESLHP